MNNYFFTSLVIFVSMPLFSMEKGLPQVMLAFSSLIQSEYAHVQCPKVFSPDGAVGLLNDFEHDATYIVRNGTEHRDTLPMAYEIDSEDSGRFPAFSGDGKWLVGWNKKLKSTLLLTRYELCSKTLSSKIEAFTQFLDWEKTDFSCVKNDTILIRTACAIFAAKISDFALKGKSALEKIYQRTDTLKYPQPFSYRAIVELFDSSIACVGPDEKSIEILAPKEDNTLALRTTITIPCVRYGMLVIDSVRGIAAINGDKSDGTIEFYQLLGEGAGMRSKIQVSHFENCIFSPCGNYLACGTNLRRQVVEIFDCKELTSPQCVRIITEAVGVGPAHCRAWIGKTLIVRDGWNKRHDIECGFVECQGKQEKKEGE